MRIWLACSAFLAGEMVGGTVTVSGGIEGEMHSGSTLVIRYDYQGYATEATYLLPW